MKGKAAVLVTILILVMSTMVSGCSNSTDSGNTSESDKSLKGQTVKVLLSAGDVGQFNAWKARSKEFTKKTGIKVKFIETPYENLLENITADGVALGGAYDIVAHPDTMGSSIKQFLEPLDNYIKRDDFDLSRWPDAYLDLSTFNGSVYSLPVRAHVQMLFYRKDIFDRLGLNPPKNWSELEKVSKRITEKTDLYGIVPYYGAGKNGQNLYMWTSYLWSNGGGIFDKNYKPIFNNNEGIEATKRYIDLLVKDKVAPPGSVTFGEQDSRTYFKQGKAAMWLGWWWVYSEFNDSKSSAKDVVGNVAFTSVPGWKGKQSRTNVSTFPLGIMKGSKHKEAAWEFLKWLSKPDLELNIVKDSLTDKSPSDQHSPVITQKGNLRNKQLNELSNGFYNVAADSLGNARTLPKIKEWPKIADILSSAISKMATGKPVKPVLDDAAKEVEQLMKKSGYYD
ncbi:carbohydrate ABC transporter substrate-binding protein (CUT1 family) [Scopulibacillus darangshiensis]|uniref:Carbohydrate ABC transporter substrate-binding protein (CUT1 family) n=1 Tax=Scopulibacillus darangshiensis TaxID=442528 RepID=A0A4R2P802_9BACL|nr:sugar ABC transporter substrate-binding protein [Scopulibacillus darangshiensis]TCP30947.1 carbohydrate ABC transporter substrate-binding protein (CUT1 family) [Scopulibacillus darangshiensis]